MPSNAIRGGKMFNIGRAFSRIFTIPGTGALQAAQRQQAEQLAAQQRAQEEAARLQREMLEAQQRAQEEASRQAEEARQLQAQQLEIQRQAQETQAAAERARQEELRRQREEEERQRQETLRQRGIETDARVGNLQQSLGRDTNRFLRMFATRLIAGSGSNAGAGFNVMA